MKARDALVSRLSDMEDKIEKLLRHISKVPTPNGQCRIKQGSGAGETSCQVIKAAAAASDDDLNDPFVKPFSPDEAQSDDDVRV